MPCRPMEVNLTSSMQQSTRTKRDFFDYVLKLGHDAQFWIHTQLAGILGLRSPRDMYGLVEVLFCMAWDNCRGFCTVGVCELTF